MSPPPHPVPRHGVRVVFVVIFLDLLGFGIVLPSLAYYVDLFSVPAWAERAGLALGIRDTRAIFVGLMQVAYSGLQLVAAPVWGGISDRVGRRPVLLASLGGFAVAWGLFATAGSLFVLIAARALAGAFGANLAAAQAYMADVYSNEARARGMGLIGMAMGLGFVFGPALGAALVSAPVLEMLFPGGVPERATVLVPGLFAAGLSAAAFLVGLFALPESLPSEARGRGTPVPVPGPQLLLRAARSAVAPLLLIYGMIILGFAGLEVMFSQFNLDRLGLGQSTNALVFVAIGLTLAAVQGGAVGPLSARFGSRRVLLAGLGLLAVGMAVFGLQTALNPGLPPVVWLVLLSVWVGGAFSLANPSALALISILAPPGQKGETMGLAASAATLGRILGPTLGGFSYAALGPESPFLLGSAIVALALGLLAAQRAALG